MHAAVCRCGEYIYAIGGQWSTFDLDNVENFFTWELPIERWEFAGPKEDKFELVKIKLPPGADFNLYFMRKNSSLAPLNEK